MHHCDWPVLTKMYTFLPGKDSRATWLGYLSRELDQHVQGVGTMDIFLPGKDSRATWR